MQDIADKAGVSRAAVSLALRNHPSLPGQTRQRIKNLAREMGYRPNPLVSALMAYQRSRRSIQPVAETIAFVAKFARSDPWQTYISPDLITGAAAAAERQGYRLEQFWIGDLEMSSDRFWKMLYQRGIHGMILAPLPAAHGYLDFRWSKFCAVTIGYSLVRPRLHRVSTDRYKAMLMAIRELKRMGYRRLGLALDINQDSRVDHQWAAAFNWQQKQAKTTEQTELFLMPSQQWTEPNFAAWFKKNRPEVVLSYDPAVIAWMEKLGKNVPQDAGFVHLWNPDDSGRYAGIYHAPPAIGEAAANFLIGLLQRNECGVPKAPQTLLLNAIWIKGASLKNQSGPVRQRLISTVRTSRPTALPARRPANFLEHAV